jgi:8-oxo-dGTP diphosphatase
MAANVSIDGLRCKRYIPGEGKSIHSMEEETMQALPRIGVGAVILDDCKRILLVLRKRNPESGKWSIPGGKVELYETLEQTIVREVKEEVGLTVTVGELLCIAQTVDELQGLHWVSPIFTVQVTGGQVENLEPETIEEVGWFELDQLPENLASFTIPAVHAIQKDGTHFPSVST